MAESSLSQGLPELRQAVGSYLSIGETVSEYDTEELAKVDRCIKSGLRMFYGAIGARENHLWTFLSPKLNLATIADQDYIDLPDDFNSLSSDVFFNDDEYRRNPLTVLVFEVLYNWRSSIADPRRPTNYCITAKESTGLTGQRFIMELFPTPDAVYNLTGRYDIQYSDALTDELPYPKGGMAHAETIEAACVAAAEIKYKNDGAGGKYGFYQILLESSIQADKRIAATMNFGYNGDGPCDTGWGNGCGGFNRIGDFYYNGEQVIPNP